MGKIFKKLTILISFGILLGIIYATLVAQIPSTRRTDRVQIMNDGIIFPDGYYCQFGTDGDIQAEYDATNDWLEFNRRTGSTASLWSGSPVASGYHDPTRVKEIYFQCIAFGDSTEYDWYDDGGGVKQSERVLGGAVELFNTATGNKVTNFQFPGEAFKVDTTNGYSIWYETEVRLMDSTDCSALFGLVTLDDDSLRGGVTSGIYFEKCPNSNVWRVAVEENTSATYDTLSITANDLTYHRFGFIADADNKTVTVYIDGTAESDVFTRTNIPDELLTPSYEIGNTDTLIIKYLWVKQELE